MASSLLHFRHETESNGQPLHWHRADLDGVPYRGQPPAYSEGEFEARTARVTDARNAFFDLHKPEQNQRYLEVVERCCSGWYRLLHLERFWRGTTCHYVEWVEYYIEDGGGLPGGGPGVLEVPAHGRADGYGDFGPHPGGP